jgi:hypothetical protein
MRRVAWAPFLLFSVAVLMSSCGGGSGTLHSIRINQQSGSGMPQFTATGSYSNGSQVTPLPASWIVWSFGSFISGQPHYRLTAAPFSPCSVSGPGAWTVAAIAPTDPHAANNGSIPMSVFGDLISGKTSAEGGFVGATMQVSCP